MKTTNFLVGFLLFVRQASALQYSLDRLQNPEDPKPPKHPKDFMPDVPIDKSVQQATIKNLQAWIAGSTTGWRSLVLMGDSTMMGISVDLLNLTDEVLKAQNIVYAANDRGHMMHFGTDLEHLEDWNDTKQLDDPIVAASVKNVKAATEHLHSRNCTWGGGINTYVYRESALKGLVLYAWDYLPEYGDRCWNGCMGVAMMALQPSAVVWNIGFHLLNEDFDSKKCEKRQNPAKPNCGNYKDLVKHVSGDFMKASPAVFFKTTNELCEHRKIEWQPDLKDTFAKWKDPKQDAALEKQCHDSCDKMGPFRCHDWVFGSETSKRMYDESIEAVEELKKSDSGAGKRLHVLDAYKATHACCNRGCDVESMDGEHYRALDRGLIHEFTSVLSKAESQNAD